jgi:acyl-coenzyme A synthetase/AMP-(fatty) acid ligase
MKPSALSAALAEDTDHVVCFGRDGRERRWSELVLAASAVKARVQESGGTRWALNLDDTFEFTAALLGCWGAGKTPVLASRPMLEAGLADLRIDGVIQATAGEARAPREILWSGLGTSGSGLGDIDARSELILYTSGSTGDPKAVSRRVHNVEAELAVLESLWGQTVGTARFYSTVSHRHVYGMLFRLLWPLLNRRPFATFDLEYPEALLDDAGRGQALVSSPALLKRIGHLPHGSSEWCAIFSSGGLLPGSAAADATRVLGACPIEVLGSTETSGVAWRQQDTSEPMNWKTMATVQIRSARDDVLEVRSPFTGGPDWLQMGDTVRLATDGTFELIGRADHLAKIEDKRVSLAEIERYLLGVPWVQDAAAVALEDGRRQYVGAVIKLSAAGTEQLQRHGRRAMNDALKQALRAKIERIALPRKFRYLDEIPVDSQGKRQQSGLRELFRSR